MARNRTSARKAGARFEQQTADYLAHTLHDDRIERRKTNGANDRGDITGLKHLGQRIVIECKDYGGRLALPAWIDELDTEIGNDDATTGFIVAKRRGVADPGQQWAICTLSHMAALLAATHHTRPEGNPE